MPMRKKTEKSRNYEVKKNGKVPYDDEAKSLLKNTQSNYHSSFDSNTHSKEKENIIKISQNNGSLPQYSNAKNSKNEQDSDDLPQMSSHGFNTPEKHNQMKGRVD